MYRLRALILLPFLAFSSLNVIKAQNATTLQPGTAIERTLGKDETQTFTVTMDEGGSAQLVVEQQGIDVVVIVSKPSGAPFRKFDTPNGADGPEHVSFVAFTAGSYRIDVTALDSNAKPGRFQIKLIEVRQATDQELKTSKNQEEAHTKAVALLGEIDGSISQIKSPVTRIQALLRASDLLWEFDEKHAAKYLWSAMGDTKDYIASLDASNEEYAQKYHFVSQLRYQIVQTLARKDPESALSFIRTTAPRKNSYVDEASIVAQESTLELAIADMILATDPERSVQIVRENLKTGYPASMLNTLTQMTQKKPELATQLAHEIATRLLAEQKLVDQPDTTNMALGLIKSFLTDKPTQIHTPVTVTLPTRVVSEDDYKQLVQKALNDVMAYKRSSFLSSSDSPLRDGMWMMLNGLRALGPELDKVVNGGAALLNKKQTELLGPNAFQATIITELPRNVASIPVESALESIEKAPADIREQLYLQLAQREATNGDTARARQIITEHVTNPYQRSEALKNIDQQEIANAMSKGKIEEALRNVSAIRNPRERAAQLSQLANQITAGRQRAEAINFLEQARNLLGSSPQAQDQSQMQALLEIARAFANHDAKRSFDILDPLIDQFNELCAAARVLQGFGTDFYEDEELDLQNGNTVGQMAQQLSNVLGSLALVNFDRAKTSADKVRLPEVRVQMYLQIAAQTIDNAP